MANSEKPYIKVRRLQGEGGWQTPNGYTIIENLAHLLRFLSDRSETKISYEIVDSEGSVISAELARELFETTGNKVARERSRKQ